MSPSLVYTVIGIMVVAVIAITVAAVRYSNRHAGRVREDFEPFLKRSAMALPASSTSESATHAGIGYTASFEPGVRNSPAYYQLSIAAKNRGGVNIRRERAVDRLFKRFGFVVEVQTKDVNFDRAIFIDSAEPVFARALFSQASARDAVTTIFACGFSEISIDGDTVSTKLLHKDTKIPRPRDIRDAIPALKRLAADQPKIPDHLGADAVKAWRWRLGIAYAFISTVGLIGAGGLWLCQAQFRPVDESTVFVHSLIFALPLLCGLLILLALLLRGRSNSHVHFGASAGIALVAAVFWAYSVLGLNNARRDTSEARRYELVVTNKTVTGSRSRTYRLFVPSWRIDGESENLAVSRTLYEQVIPERTQVAIITRAGHFGYEWFVQTAAIVAPSRSTESSSSALRKYE